MPEGLRVRENIMPEPRVGRNWGLVADLFVRSTLKEKIDYQKKRF